MGPASICGYLHTWGPAWTVHTVECHSDHRRLETCSYWPWTYVGRWYWTSPTSSGRINGLLIKMIKIDRSDRSDVYPVPMNISRSWYRWQKKNSKMILKRWKELLIFISRQVFLLLTMREREREREGGGETDLCFPAIFGTAWTLSQNLFMTLLMDSTVTNCKFILNNKCNQ